MQKIRGLSPDPHRVQSLPLDGPPGADGGDRDVQVGQGRTRKYKEGLGRIGLERSDFGIQ